MLLIGAPRSRPSLFSPRHLWDRGVAATVTRKKLILCGPAETGIAALTFEGGPHPQNTPKLLRVLKAHRVTATFLMSGENVRQFPDVADWIAEEGHAIGHCGFFSKPAATMTEDAFVEDLTMADHWIREATGDDVRWYRPAHRTLSLAQMRLIWRRGKTVLLWNHDSGDTLCDSTAKLSLRFANYPIRRGDVVRLHDSAPYTAAALAKMLPGAIRYGVEFKSPREWLA